MQKGRCSHWNSRKEKTVQGGRKEEGVKERGSLVEGKSGRDN